MGYLPVRVRFVQGFSQLSEAKQRTTRYAGARQEVIQKNNHLSL